MDTNSVGFWALALIAGILLLEFTLAHVTARAARMKGRSYNSFFWLSLLFRPAILWLVIASLPFQKNDPRSPLSDTKPDEEPEDRHINPWAAQPLIGSVEAVLIVIGVLLVIISIANLAVPVLQYYTGMMNPYGEE
jgi:hypothetical protein